jgi:tRNA nucleotidyltransferase (CCA-adding enzyme)
LEGRPPRQDEFPEGPWLLEQAERLKVKDSEPQPIVLGRHLVDRGHEPGPSFGPILEKCFEAQLDGEFHDETNGLSYLDSLLKQKH